jgi:type II secretory ATPase GspE/PulE/Tfp pilus assembly ATPase PilB-like protein
MKLDQNQIKEILLNGHYIEEKDAKEAEDFVKNKEGSFLDYFNRTGLLTPDLIGQALAEFYKVTYVDLNTNTPTKEIVLKIPEELAIRRRVIFFSDKPDSVLLTTDEPDQVGILDELKTLFTDKKIIIGFSLSQDVDSALLFYRKTLETRFNQILKEQKKVAPEIVNEILDDALAFRTSDIHFDIYDKEVVIRFRIDGVLHEAGRIPKEYYENVLNRVKVQSIMRTDEHFSSQDGSMRYEKNGKSIDMRVSVVPVFGGEKIVIRILAENSSTFNLSEVGLSKKNEEIVMKAAEKPFGMILVVGPTGSGKTTTLYTLIRYLNKPEINIATIEDPVEYRIPGVSHIQVNQATNLTFAKGLRSIARQDPDVILVGEIRDLETADIAVNAALTGHLLFSTFHANDSASAIPRMLEMGIEPFLLSSTLELIVAQRLVRKICDKCRYSYKASLAEISKDFPNVEIFFKDGENLYKGKGCQNCSNTGFKGRTAIFELIEISREIEDIILKRPSAGQIWEIAKKQGSKPLFADGLEKVKTGVTTIEELLRIAEVPDEMLKNNTKQKDAQK